MKNSEFEILLDKESGSIISLVNPKDTAGMNWCSDNGSWGFPHSINRINVYACKEAELINFTENENGSTALYSNGALSITVDRFFSEKGCLTERFTFKNLRDGDVFLEHGDIQIELPLNDNYTYADECMTNRCNAHLWCAGTVAYINALKMGVSDINLGVVLTKGAIASYSIKDCKSNHRGTFLLDCEHIELRKDEEYVIEWEIFWYKGTDDFYTKALSYPGFINIVSDNFTVFEHEDICFTIVSDHELPGLAIYCDGRKCDFIRDGDNISVTYKPKRLGEHKFEIFTEHTHTYTEFFVSESIEKLIKKRIEFIVDKQQYHREGSKLDGAFLIYDNDEKYPVYDSVISDHNACRERVGMALLIIKYLQQNEDLKIRAAFDKYITFLMREIFDPETGEVFNEVGRDKKHIRLYNAPWISTLFTEMYILTEDKTYLSYIMKLLKVYYDQGGHKFYPNGLSMENTVKAFEKAEMYDEKTQVIDWFKAHVDNIVKNGVSYPKHEVNFEQTIVTPAATFISEMARITEDKAYIKEALKHINVLKRFNGRQPSFHLNEIPIRYWDDFWFGKSRLFGDTFPHYWSCLTARSYFEYYKASADESYRKAAEKCIRNCLCLFNEKGEGSCAYVYPFKTNGSNGRFYDAWGNDQDFALYFLLQIYDLIEKFPSPLLI